MTHPYAEEPTEPRPCVLYHPPYLRQQPTRSVTLPHVWADVRRFVEHIAEPFGDEEPEIVLTTRRWSAASMQHADHDWLGEWPSECSLAEHAEAVRVANEQFGVPAHRDRVGRAHEDGLELEEIWFIPVERVDEVLAYLERFSSCTGGGDYPPLHASYSCAFHLRDLATGAVLPGQGPQHHPRFSFLSVKLQRPSTANLTLVLPFAEADASAAEYVVALQESAPVWMDPHYFDHVVPTDDGSGFRRTRLPADWLGCTVDGAPRLDASRSGLTPPVGVLPSEREMAAEDRARDDAPYVANFAIVEAALRDHPMAAMIVRGPGGSMERYMVEQAAKRLDLPVHVVEPVGVDAGPPTLADALRAVVAGLPDRPAVLLVEDGFVERRKGYAEVLAQAAAREPGGAALPPSIRFVLTEMTRSGAATVAAGNRYATVRDEGFATRAQLHYLERQSSRAGFRDVVVELLDHPSPSHHRSP